VWSLTDQQSPCSLTGLIQGGVVGVLLDAGFTIQRHPNGTAIEGEWAPVFQAIETCHAAVHAMGAPRIFTTVKVNTRTDRDQTLEAKVASIEALLQQLPEGGGLAQVSWTGG
jgi:uncharacterized protein (TIGR00106 family)